MTPSSAAATTPSSAPPPSTAVAWTRSTAKTCQTQYAKLKTSGWCFITFLFSAIFSTHFLFRWSNSLSGSYGPFKRCVCVPGAQPMSRDLSTGLVPGCQQPPGDIGGEGEEGSSDATVDDCAEMVTLPVENVSEKHCDCTVYTGSFISLFSFFPKPSNCIFLFSFFLSLSPSFPHFHF